MQIGNVTIKHPYILAPMAGDNRPAISSAMQRAGRGTAVYGNDQCQGITV